MPNYHIPQSDKMSPSVIDTPKFDTSIRGQEGYLALPRRVYGQEGPRWTKITTLHDDRLRFRFLCCSGLCELV